MPDRGAQGLADYLKQNRVNREPCWHERTDPALVTQVNAAIAAGSKQWSAMARWLGEQGEDISKYRIVRHAETCLGKS